MGSYVLNEYHTKGKEKFKSLKNTFGVKGNAESANRLYNFICNRLVDYENNLYEVAYTQYGIVCRYVSAFVHHNDPTKVVYMIHGWISKYYFPNEEDLKILLDKKGPDFDTGGPFREGWGRLTTLYVSNFKNLTKVQKDFVL